MEHPLVCSYQLRKHNVRSFCFATIMFTMLVKTIFKNHIDHSRNHRFIFSICALHLVCEIYIQLWIQSGSNPRGDINFGYSLPCDLKHNWWRWDRSILLSMVFRRKWKWKSRNKTRQEFELGTPKFCSELLTQRIDRLLN